MARITPEPSEIDCDECQSSGIAEEDCSECGGSGEVKCDGGEHECEECLGTGKREVECEECQGNGTYTPDEPTEDQIDEWRDDTLSGHPINDSPA